MLITYFLRKQKHGFNSIEELFQGIADITGKRSQVRMCYAPTKRASPFGIIRNLFFAWTNKTDVNHITGDVHYLGIVLGKSSILTIHDIRSALHGNMLRKFYIFFFWFYLPARRSKVITTISEFSKEEIVKLIPFTKDKIKVIYNPYRKELLDPLYTQNNNMSSGVRFKIMLIGTKPNKNLERTIKALNGLNVTLQILGKLNDQQLKLLKSSGLHYDNRFRLSYQEVIDWYAESDMVCFASTYEGFGMPIIESQALGKPVVTSNLGAMKEIAGDSACLVNPFDHESIRDGVKRIISDKHYREKLVRKGKVNIERFSPEKISGQYFDLYKLVGIR